MISKPSKLRPMPRKAWSLVLLISIFLLAPIVPGLEAANQPPVAEPDIVELGSHSLYSGTYEVLIDPLANDSDADGNLLEIVAVGPLLAPDGSGPGAGVLTNNGDGTLTYQVSATEAALVTFDYTVREVGGGSQNATATVTIGALQLLPKLGDFRLASGKVLVITESDLQTLAGQSAAVTGLGVPDVGMWRQVSSSSPVPALWEPPTASWTGIAAFEYWLQGEGAPRSATIEVVPPAGLVHARDDRFQAFAGGCFALELENLLDNDLGSELDLYLTESFVQALNRGWAVFHQPAVPGSSTLLSYQNMAAPGLDYFEYLAVSGTREDLATAILEVGPAEPFNHPPRPSQDFFPAILGATYELEVLANDWDPDCDGLTVTSAPGGATFYAAPTADGQRIQFRAFQPGTVQLTYTVADGMGGSAPAAVTLEVLPDAGAVPPQATFPVPLCGSGTLTCSFDGGQIQQGRGSDGSVHLVNRWIWNFGDGTIEERTSNQQPIFDHTFPSPGSYSVTLTVVDVVGLSDTFGRTLQISGTPLTVVFSMDCETRPAPDGDFFCNLDGTGTLTASGLDPSQIQDVSWDLGSGFVIGPLDRSATFPLLPNPRLLTLRLRVQDVFGHLEIAQQTLRLEDRRPTAALAARCNGTGCILDGSASSDDQGILEYLWDFGDGSTPAAGPIVASRVYGSPAVYTVHLTVTDAAAQSHSTSLAVDATAGPVVAEVGTAVVRAASASVAFRSAYQNPVIVASLDRGLSEKAIRLRVVPTTQGFEAFLLDPEGGVANPASVHLDGARLHYVVAEAGTWQLADGTLLEAGLAAPQGWRSVSLGSWLPIPFDTHRSAPPVLLAGVHSVPGSAGFSETLNARVRTVGTDGFEVAVEGPESRTYRPSPAAADRIAWIALDPSASAGPFALTAGDTGITVSSSGLALPLPPFFAGRGALIASLASAVEGDPAVAAWQSQGDSAWLWVEEDRTADGEILHHEERVTWLAADSPAFLSGASYLGGPVALDDFAVLTDLAPVTLTVTANDRSLQGGTLSVSLSEPPSFGAAAVVGDQIRYTPNPFQGPAAPTADAFTYRLLDSAGGTNLAQVFLSLNRAPANLPEAVVVRVDGEKPLFLEANALDADLDVVTLAGGGATASAGTVSLGAGTVTYVPPAGFVGLDTFTYQVMDPLGAASIPVTAQLHVLPPYGPSSQSPQAQADLAYSVGGGPARVNLTGNDWDADGDAIELVDVWLDPAAANPALPLAIRILDGGWVELDPELTPEKVLALPSWFLKYRVRDSGGDVSEGDLQLFTYLAVGYWNPQPGNDRAATAVNTPILLDVLANDIDLDWDPISVTSLWGPPVHGSAVVAPDGKILYTPAPGFVGYDRFLYFASDGPHAERGAVEIVVGDPERLAAGALKDAAVVALELPATLACGELFTGASITMRNLGSETWNREDLYRLSTVDGTADPLAVQFNRPIAPGATASTYQNYTFTMDFQAPAGAGTYLTRWQVRRGAEWFGDTVDHAVEVVCPPSEGI